MEDLLRIYLRACRYTMSDHLNGRCADDTYVTIYLYRGALLITGITCSLVKLQREMTVCDGFLLYHFKARIFIFVTVLKI